MNSSDFCFPCGSDPTRSGRISDITDWKRLAGKNERHRRFTKVVTRGGTRKTGRQWGKE